MIDKSDVKISWVEIILVAAAFVAIDLLQIGIEFLNVIPVVGTIIAFFLSSFTDLIAGFSLFMYCFIRGVRLTPLQTTSILLAFLLELIPFLGGAPFWTIDVLIILLSEKGNESKLAKIGAVVISAIPVKGPKGRPASTPPPLPKEVPPPLPRNTPPPLPANPSKRTPPPLPGQYVSGRGMSELEDDRHYIEADIKQYGEESHSNFESPTTPPPLPKEVPPPLPRNTPPPLPDNNEQIA
jgi:hypothetical protein